MSSRCAAVGSVWYSTQQWIEATTTSAPASLAACACAMIPLASAALASKRLTAHGLSAGTGSPLVPYAQERCATVMNRFPAWTLYNWGRDASSGLVEVPTAPMRTSSNAPRLATMPAQLLSTMWFDAVEQPSHPCCLSAGTISGGAEKTGKPLGLVPGGATGVSMWQIARSAPEIQGSSSLHSGSMLNAPPRLASSTTAPWGRTSPAATRVKETGPSGSTTTGSSEGVTRGAAAVSWYASTRPRRSGSVYPVTARTAAPIATIPTSAAAAMTMTR